MASNDTAKTIVLKGTPPIKEAVMTASEGIIPGHLVTLVEAGTLSKNATALQGCPKAFAVEADFSGGDIDTAYSNGETVKYAIAQPGDEINAILADNQTITIGELLESAGDGTLQTLTAFVPDVVDTSVAADGGVAIAMAVEAVTTSGGTARLKVEVL